MTNFLEMPLYATRSRRRIAGTDFVAVTMYRSSDNSVRDYAIFTADGKAHLGTVHYQPETRTRSRCYTMQSVPMLRDERWPTLAAYATEMAQRLELRDQAWKVTP